MVGLLGGVVFAAILRVGWGTVLASTLVCIALPLVAYTLYQLAH
ncbi:MAG: hypothetical protein ABR600_08495 [Actinomycetota bacterium]